MGVLLAPQLTASMKAYGIPYAMLTDGLSGNLSRTFGTATDVKIFTIHASVARWEDGTGAYQYILSSDYGGSAYNGLYINGTDDKLHFYTSNSVDCYYITTQVMRDFGPFFDVTVSYNSTLATAADRVKIYINGVRVTAFDLATMPALNSVIGGFNEPVAHYIGVNYPPAANYAGFYLGGNYYFIDGQEKTPLNFGKFDTETGNWVAKKYTGAYGANGFHLDFSDPAYLGLNADATGAFSTNLCRNGTSSVDIGSAVNLPNCFDGDQYNAYAVNAPYVAAVGLANFYAGKDWGVGVTKTITGFRVFPTTDYYGYSTAASGTMTIKLQGSTDNFATSIVDLHSASGIAQSTANIYTVSNAITTTTAYRYHRIMMYEDTPSGLSHAICLSEVEFFEAGNHAIDGHWNAFGGLSQVTSTPTNVYGAINPLDAVPGSTEVLSNGNRTHTGGANWDSLGCTLLSEYDVPIYFEYVPNTTTATLVGLGVGLAASDWDKATLHNGTTRVWAFTAQASRYLNANGTYVTVAGVLTASTDIVQVARYGDWVWVGVNDVWYDSAGGTTGNPETLANPTFTIAGSNSLKLRPCVGGYSAGGTIRFAEAEWTKTSPSWAKSLCTNNLPKITDSIHNHWSNFAYTGDGLNGHALTGFGIAPTFAWIKERGAIRDHLLVDALRGPTKELGTNKFDAETTATDRVVSFDADGLTLNADTASGWCNWSGSNYIAWCAFLPKTASAWGFGETITPSGEIYNDSAMFKMSVVTYTGNGVAGASLPHSLGVKPGFIIIKKLSDAADYWQTYHSAIGATKSTQFNTGFAAIANVGYWNNTEPTSTLITLGTSTGMNQNTSTYVAYIFAPCDGIKIGSYLGNASSDGPFLNENISPIWMLHKADTIANWHIWDAARSPGNPVKETLFAESSAAETSLYNRLDFTSVGMKGRDGTVHPSSFTGLNCYVMIGQPNGPTENPAR